MKRASHGGRLLMAVMGVVFTGVGIFMAGLIVRTVTEARAMRQWPVVPATILAVELERGGGDSDTLRATARYAYEYEGRAFEGTRVGLHGGSDNIGSWQRTTFKALKQAYTDRRQVTCRVNPAHPAEAILYPALRVEMLLFYSVFVLVFGASGLGMLVAVVVVGRRARRAEAAVLQHPGEHWRVREDWAQGVIRSGNRVQAWVLTGFATFWNIMVFGFLAVSHKELFSRGGPALFFLLFPVVGVGLAAWALREWLVARKYGAAVFRLASVPGVLGGKLAGAVQLPGDVRAPGGLTVMLQCAETVRSGKNSDERILWQDECHLDVEALPRDGQGLLVPVLFAPPYDQPASSEGAATRRVRWNLLVKARQPGVDVDLRFEVPVFQTEESRADFQLDARPVARYVAQKSVEELLRAERVEMDLRGSTLILTFPAARRPGVALAATAFAAVWIGATVFLFRQEAPLLFRVVFGASCLFIAAAVLDAWLGVARVEADRDGLRWRLNWLGLRWARALPAADVTKVAVEMGSQTNQRVNYRVRAVESNGRRRTLGREFADKAAAEAAAREIQQALGSQRRIEHATPDP